MRRKLACSVVAALFVVGSVASGCQGVERQESEEIASAEQAIDELNPTAAGLTIVARPTQWSTTDGSWGDTSCVAGETAVATAGGTLCVIGTHGGPGVIQCMPPPGVFAGSGATDLVCSVCYAGTPTTLSGENGVAQAIAVQQGVACQNVIACTGSVAPRGIQPTPGGGGTCATLECQGVWVNGCSPPQAISPSAPGVCFTTTQPPSFPIPTKVTVGCFAGDLPHDVWNRCRQRYASHVTSSGLFSDTTCADEWASADGSSVGFQTCNALVRTCIQSTQAACAAMAPPPPPAGGGGPVAGNPPPLQCVQCVAGEAPQCQAAVAGPDGQVQPGGALGACQGDLPFLVAGVCPMSGQGWTDAGPTGCAARAPGVPPAAPPSSGGCAVGLLSCDGVCADPSSDNANCGACGNACAEGLVCSGGSCVPAGGGGGGGSGGGGTGSSGTGATGGWTGSFGMGATGGGTGSFGMGATGGGTGSSGMGATGGGPAAP